MHPTKLFLLHVTTFELTRESFFNKTSNLKFGSRNDLSRISFDHVILFSSISYSTAHQFRAQYSCRTYILHGTIEYRGTAVLEERNIDCVSAVLILF